MKSDNKHGYELPKLGLPPLIHDYLYNNPSAIGELKTGITKTPVKAYRDMWLAEKARADLLESHIEELIEWVSPVNPPLAPLLKRHERERKALGDNK
jgi:hypothetical protein